jgi:hypothetical protein
MTLTPSVHQTCTVNGILAVVKLSLADWLGIAALVVALGVGVVTVLATRHWGNRRREILFSYDTTSLLPKGRQSGPLQVTYRDIPVKNPHLTTIRVKNIGPYDIGTQQFDAGRPLKISLNCPMYGLTRNSSPSSTVSTAIGEQGVLELTPMLIRRGEEWITEVVTEGEAKPKLDSPLIDTDVTRDSDQNILFKLNLFGTEFGFVTSK